MSLKRLVVVPCLAGLAVSSWGGTIPAPVVRYTFDAPFGFEEPNATGSGYSATIPRNSIQQEAPRREPGLFGNAVRHAGRQNIKSTFPAGRVFTVCFWVFPEQLDAPDIFGCSDQIRVGIERHRPRLYAKVGGASLSTEIRTGQWSCVALISDGQECALYLNGQQVGQDATTLPADPKDHPMTFGGVAAAHHQLQGLIDEFRIYDRALTAEQIAVVSDRDQALQTVPPVADAGVDHTVYLVVGKGVTVPLAGRVAGGDATAIAWSPAGKPKDAEVAFDNPEALDTTANFTAPGDYELTLTVDSPQGQSMDTIRVVVFPPHPKREPAKLYENPETPGTHITSHTNMGDDKTPPPYDPEFVKKNFPPRESKLQSKGFARDRFRTPPPPYVHPRVFFNPEDLPAMRKRIKYGKAAGAAYAKVSRMYEMMTRGRGVPKDYFSPGGKNGRGSWDGGAGAGYCIGAFTALIEGDTELARRLIDGAVRIADAQLAALETLKTAEDKRNWQNIKHGILARYTTSYVYDFLYSWMTRQEQDKLRKVISGCTSGVHSIGMFSVPNAVAASNWVAWVTGDLLANVLAIEGEDGFDPVVAAEAINAMAKFSRYGILPDGSSFEGMGKNSITGQNLVAMAKRGNLAIAYESVYNCYVGFHLHLMQPYGKQFIFDDLWGFSRSGGKAPDAAVMKYAYPDDPVIDFVYRNIVKGKEYQTPLFKTTYGYHSALNNCWFGEDWTGPDDWNAHAAEALRRQPLDAHFNYTNIATARSAWQKDAAYLYFLPRMLGGHNSPARGTFVFSALGRDWCIYPTGHNDKSTLQHSVITVDGQSVRANWGRMIAFESSKDRMIAAVDLRDYYASRGDASLSQNHFRVKPASEPWFDLPGWQMPHWFAGNRPNQKDAPVSDRRPPARTAYRAAAFVRPSAGSEQARPYAVIADEMNIDGLSHHYRWQIVLPADLCGQVTVKDNDAIITDPDTGNFVLVRPVKSNVEVAAKYEETEWARGVIAFETECPSWEFAVLLMPFRKGESPPPGTDIPKLDRILEAMMDVVAEEKARVAKQAEAEQKEVLKQLGAFTPASLGEPSPIQIPDTSLKRVKGIVGQAYEFDGEESLGVPAGLPPFDTQTPFTVAFWAKAKRGKLEGMLYAHNGNRGLTMAIFQGRSLKVSVDNNWYWSRPPQQLADWCHLAFTYDGKRIAFYQNGALVKEGERTGRMESHQGGTRLGQGFRGWIDDLRVYPQALTEDQVASLHKYQRYMQGDAIPVP